MIVPLGQSWYNLHITLLSSTFWNNSRTYIYILKYSDTLGVFKRAIKCHTPRFPNYQTCVIPRIKYCWFQLIIKVLSSNGYKIQYLNKESVSRICCWKCAEWIMGNAKATPFWMTSTGKGSMFGFHTRVPLRFYACHFTLFFFNLMSKKCYLITASIFI